MLSADETPVLGRTNAQATYRALIEFTDGKRDHRRSPMLRLTSLTAHP